MCLGVNTRLPGLFLLGCAVCYSSCPLDISTDSSLLITSVVVGGAVLTQTIVAIRSWGFVYLGSLLHVLSD